MGRHEAARHDIIRYRTAYLKTTDLAYLLHGCQEVDLHRSRYANPTPTLREPYKTLENHAHWWELLGR